mgnify:CR=1 FL=1
MRIGLFGLPGSGKTVTAQRLSEKLNLCLVKTGTLLRELESEDSERGREIKRALTEGSLADNFLVSEIVKEKIEGQDCLNGFIVDGYPRDIEQLKSFDPEFSHVIFLKVSEKTVRERLLKRGREDDTPEVIEKRLEVQTDELGRVLDHYKDNLIEIDGEKTEEEVYQNILDELKTKN